MAFQIVDDILDFTASDEELGKPSGHDLVEGIYTLPVILTLASGGVAVAFGLVAFTPAADLTGVLPVAVVITVAASAARWRPYLL